MTDKPTQWLDLLLTAWIVVIGVVYFGGYFIPAIGALTTNVAAFYALMVIVSVFVLTTRHLRRNEKNMGKTDTKTDETRTKNRK